MGKKTFFDQAYITLDKKNLFDADLKFKAHLQKILFHQAYI